MIERRVLTHYLLLSIETLQVALAEMLIYVASMTAFAQVSLFPFNALDCTNTPRIVRKIHDQINHDKLKT